MTLTQKTFGTQTTIQAKYHYPSARRDSFVVVELWHALGGDVEELGDDLERQALGLGHPKRDEGERDTAHGGIDGEDPGEPQVVEHHRHAVGDGDVAEPEGEGADGDAHSAHPRREDLGAQDARDGPEPHDERADVDDDARGRHGGVQGGRQGEHVRRHQGH